MQTSAFKIPTPVNEPILTYLKGSAEREALKAALLQVESEVMDIPCIIGGKEFRTNHFYEVKMPHDHHHVLARVHLAGPKEVKMAVDAALKAKKEWESLAWSERSKIFLKAADLLAGDWRPIINAATMHGQSKNAYQAEIDSACEWIDFLRFNAHFYENILKEQPFSPPGVHNSSDYRPLEGFVFAITPFNFTAIAGNLPCAPALVGNTVVWKPSETQTLAAYRCMQLLMEAGLPPGVINFIPAEGPVAGAVVLPHPELAGIHFTGSTPTFNHIYKTVAEHIETYRSYPRIVGETGGKDFVFAHASADLDVLRVALIRGSYEYQGQKCSAASRAYIPSSVWAKLQKPLIEEINSLKMGDVRDFRNLINAVIDERSFKRIGTYIDYAKSESSMKILAGGVVEGKTGYFVRPTLLQAMDPKARTMCEEIFGPVLSVFVYEDSQLSETLQLANDTSPYALTGAIITQDRQAMVQMMDSLKHASGNFYINDKPTGAVVGQQPFGGARRSGTNDKAGSALNLTRFMSVRTIKENFVPPKQVLYPYMNEA